MSTRINKKTQEYSREQMNEIREASEVLNEYFNNDIDKPMVVNDLEAAKLLLNNVEPLINSIWPSGSISCGDFKKEVMDRLDGDSDFISDEVLESMAKALDLVAADATKEVHRVCGEIHTLLTTICKGDETLSKDLIEVFREQVVLCGV